MRPGTGDFAGLDPEDPALAGAVGSALLEALLPVTPEPSVAARLRASLEGRLRQGRERARHLRVVRREAGVWRPLAAGARVKVLDDAGAARSVLVELAPGSALPMHRHHEHEECVVLAGEARLGELVVRRGDYHVAPAGSRHGRVSSPAGAIVYLRGVPIGSNVETVRDLVTAWLPGRGAAPVTVRKGEGVWREAGQGVQVQTLRQDATGESLFVRMAPGATLDSWPGDAAEECLLLEGEAFLGDTLLREGDYRIADRAGPDGPAFSDLGATLFVRRTAAPAAVR